MSKYKIILSVCETGSISKTATQLKYTQSAISQNIKSFEKELGFKMFYRSRNGMELMPNTEKIVSSLKAICYEQEKIDKIATNLKSLDLGKIRIGSIQSVSYSFLPLILKQFSNLYPNINFELTIGGFKELENKLNENKLDCIFGTEYAFPNTNFVPITKDELMLVTPKNHILSDKITVCINDIENYDFILSSDGLSYETGKIFKLNNISPKIKYQLNEDFATIKMVEQNFGITILPKLLLKNIPFDVCIRSFNEHYTRTLGLAYSKNTEPMLITLKFLEFLKDFQLSEIV